MGKLPDLDCSQIVGARRMGHSISDIVRPLGVSRCFGTRRERPSHSTNDTAMPAYDNIWQVIPVEPFQKIVESVPRRVAAVIKARGDRTLY
ncbi:hypothetical protein TNCV_2455191 [Trichonephila clavipes]|nr:hypothetical protein TNCV_2455191 [Trichonephila clavipes]